MVLASLVLLGCTSASRTSAVVIVEATGCRLRPISALGVVVDEGLVATVAHAVAGEEDIFVRTSDGRERRAVVAAIDTMMDAAVLRVDDLEVEPVGRREHEPGEEVTLIVEADDVLTEQVIQIDRRVSVRTADIYRNGEHLRPGYELIADVRGGDSGAPVLGDDGRVLGLVWARSGERENRAWALPIASVDPLLAAATARTPAPETPCAR